MKKVFIGVGHGGSDPGAVANGFKESVINLKVANVVKDELIRHGVEVKMSRYKDENDNISDEIKECNAFNPHLALDIHTNAGGGDGFEVYYYSGGGTSKVMAININDEVIKIGQNSRGIKTKLTSNGNDYFGFIRDTRCPAIICEGFFIDNKNDLKDFDTDAELKKLAVAYAKGVLRTLGISYKVEAPTTSGEEIFYRVVAGSYKDRKLADAQVEALAKKGIKDTFIAVFKK